MPNQPTSATAGACAPGSKVHLGRLFTRARHAAAAVFALGLAAMMSSCLITEVPDFPPPERTPPFFIASSAIPALDIIHLIPADAEEFEVSAEVRSEDVPNADDAEEGQVVYKLLIDYGRANGTLYPYLQSVWTDRLAAATFDQRDRIATARWIRDNGAPIGCHTFTLVASHEFRSQVPDGCPSDLDDAAFLTWHVYICGDTDCLAGMTPSCPTGSPTAVCSCPSDPDYDYNNGQNPLCVSSASP